MRGRDILILSKSENLSKKKPKVLVAMSGGVDSSVAAYLLKEQGYDVTGATIKTWVANSCTSKNTRACCGVQGVEDARSVCRRLDIPYFVLDFEEDFKKGVVDYFADEYRKGRTPNPCIACNEIIKFKKFLERGNELGFDLMATGHYARRIEEGGRFYVAEGIDKTKDQAYVLFPLVQKDLARTLFPVGEEKKTRIREIARELNLRVADKPDSMEICFIPSNDYGKFMVEEGGATAQKGVIRLSTGEILGEHEGYFHYTIGQRKGMGIGYKEPLYVIKTIPETNEVIVGTKEDVKATTFTVGRMNWMMEAKGGERMEVEAKIRSNSPKVAASIEVSSDAEVAHVIFHSAQEAITPGQAGVFFEGDKVIGGGWIESVDD
jgi:tRNA-specific 2-thiouridylase